MHRKYEEEFRRAEHAGIVPNLLLPLRIPMKAGDFGGAFKESRGLWGGASKKNREGYKWCTPRPRQGRVYPSPIRSLSVRLAPEWGSPTIKSRTKSSGDSLSHNCPSTGHPWHYGRLFNGVCFNSGQGQRLRSVIENAESVYESHTTTLLY